MAGLLGPRGECLRWLLVEQLAEVEGAGEGAPFRTRMPPLLTPFAYGQAGTAASLLAWMEARDVCMPWRAPLPVIAKAQPRLGRPAAVGALILERSATPLLAATRTLGVAWVVRTLALRGCRAADAPLAHRRALRCAEEAWSSPL